MPCQFLMFLNLLTVVGTVVALSRPRLEWWHVTGGIAPAPSTPGPVFQTTTSPVATDRAVQVVF